MSTKVDQHEWVQRLQAMAIELGETPQRDVFRGKWGSSWSASFGGWISFVHAAGLSPTIRITPKKIDNSIFEKSITDHLEAYTPAPYQYRTEPWPTIASISDIHRPFHNKRVIDLFTEFCGDTQPEWIIENGDGWDMYSHGRFPRSHNVFTPREERSLSREQHTEFWRMLVKICPTAKKVQLLGNHDIRPMKKILEAYPEAEDWIAEKLKEDFTFDGVQTIYDHRQELVIGDIAIFHGYRSQLGAHRDYTLYNTINGHTHKGGAVFKQIKGKCLWELNSGLAGDPEAKGLTYTPQKITTWTPGFGAVDAKGPRFIPA